MNHAEKKVKKEKKKGSMHYHDQSQDAHLKNVMLG